MTLKYKVQFRTPSTLSPSMVYISESPSFGGKFSVGILYPKTKSGRFDEDNALALNLDLIQNLFDSQEECIAWAKEWLTRSDCEIFLQKVD